MAAAATSPIVTVNQADLAANSSNVQQGFKDGIFYFQLPQEVQALVKHGIDFAGSFYKDADLKARKFENRTHGGREYPEHTGYLDRGRQAESFFCERRFWKELFSPELQELAQKSAGIAAKIFKAALACSAIPDQEHSKASGRVLEDDGQYHFSFNHYRPEIQKSGMDPHTDWGFITVLYIFDEGLRAQIGDTWHSVPPQEGCCVINVAAALQTLVNDPEVLTAGLHQVDTVKTERKTFGLFLDPAPDSTLYAWKGGQLEVVRAPYGKYIEERKEGSYAKEG